MPPITSFDIPVAHIDEPETIGPLLASLHQIHGPKFRFAITPWQGQVQISSPPNETTYHFVMRAYKATIALDAGDVVRGLRGTDAPFAHVQNPIEEPLWPGDVIVTNSAIGNTTVNGSGVFYEVTSETTAYLAPKAAFLRNLPDHPGGCAAYKNAFRREVIRPESPPPNTRDAIGTNRVNEHTLDMRPDRTPLPSKHHHGQVQSPSGLVNHTETALVLPRATYGLPLPNNNEEGHAIIYRDPINKGTSDSFKIPTRPGSIIVTPSTDKGLFGHSFANAFAMLVAVPGFVAPYVMIPEQNAGS